MGTSEFRIDPVSGALGARISGIDFRKITDNQFERLREAWHRYLVVFLVDQEVDPVAQRDFAQRFGPLLDRGWDVDDSSPLPKPVSPECTSVVRVIEDARADAWHSDATYRRSPTVGSVFQYVAGPPAGGDTMWSSQYAAFETLSAPIRELLTGLTAVHTAAASMAPERQAVHPVVRVHPETGRPALYVNRAHTAHIRELSRPESNALLRFLFEHSEQPRFSCRWNWSPGDIAVWDNRCTMHHAVNDYGDAQRRAHRAMVSGDRPKPYRASSWAAVAEHGFQLSEGVARHLNGPN